MFAPVPEAVIMAVFHQKAKIALTSHCSVLRKKRF